MTFNKIQPKHSGLGTGIKATVRVDRFDEPTLYLSLQPHIQQLFSSTLDTFEIEVGEGDHYGFLRIFPSSQGPFKPRKIKGDTVTFTLGRFNALPIVPQQGRWCTYTQDGEALIIKLPSWAFNKPEPGPKIAVGDQVVRSTNPAARKSRDYSEYK